ncbi:nucleoside hydrolase [Agrobacterium sp. CNPSo 2736]|uniref:nucleoside hydrolase n=1 Tax=Agrobacterium TaxID=357 RepID=UPI000FDCADBB|nr:nucleoside hydrolase [Agrobacterium sp. CNPSo 2736]NSZ73921.1 nucleoside hydrolase [Agrobacterium tumefaciens]RVT75654.1 nucleoside hydrolase [Agrobacterium sp. CNPSo 2736]
MTDYPERWSQVEVTFTDGTIETYEIKAGSSFGRHLAKQAGEDNVLTLLCGPKVHSFPLASVRSWTLSELEGKPE